MCFDLPQLTGFNLPMGSPARDLPDDLAAVRLPRYLGVLMCADVALTQQQILTVCDSCADQGISHELVVDYGLHHLLRYSSNFVRNFVSGIRRNPGRLLLAKDRACPQLLFAEDNLLRFGC